MPGPSRRFLGIAATGAAAVSLPVAAASPPPAAVSRLHAEQRSLAHERRSAVLGLYSLDTRLGGAAARLRVLRAQATALRDERALLRREVRLARAGEGALQLRLAARLRALYDRGGTSALDVILGATSLGDVVTRLDDLDRMSSLDEGLLTELRATRTREARARARLAGRAVLLAAAVRSAEAEARALAAARAARAAYVARLASREAITGRRLARLEARSREAAARSRAPAHGLSAVAEPAPAASRGGLTVVATGYCLTGTTSTGIPAGWGVAAVDPSVIPLGTRLSVPGYGEAVAADTGGSVVGDRVDLWFPTCARAGGWGTRSVTIALH